VLNHVHFLWTMLGPDSSYSVVLTHISSKVEREERIDPPIQTEYFLSGGATVWIVMVEGATSVNSLCNRSASLSNMVDPPDMTTFFHKSLLISTSHFMMEFKTNLNTFVFFTNHAWLKENFWASESFVSDGDDITIGKSVLNFEFSR